MADGGRPARQELLRRIAELERALDPQLQDWRQVGRLDFGFLETAALWAKAVWMTADGCGPATLSPETVERGRALAREPVFICGAHRSGTTLLRDLLDGHPELIAVPSESDFFARLDPVLGRMSGAERTRFLTQTWLQRLVNPGNLPPYWLLGRSDERGSPYVEFARGFRAWSTALETLGRSAPLAACALACAGAGELPERARFWVEKTPLNERFLDRIWNDFPRARVLHVVRSPEAVMASCKAMLARAGMRRFALAPMLYNLARSYRIALARRCDEPAGRYRLVRYEDLVANPDGTMGAVARFLGIEPLPILSRPTIAGLPSTRNTSFPTGRRGTADGLTAIERGILELTLRGKAARLGYARIEPG